MVLGGLHQGMTPLEMASAYGVFANAGNYAPPLLIEQVTDASGEVVFEREPQAEGEAVDLYRFTSVIMRSVNEEGRLRIIEMMWELVYADGQVSEFEDNVVWRAADLLGRCELLVVVEVAVGIDVRHSEGP
jgi:membrane carboxypeptidase/penicillin-binding protein